MPIAGSDAAPRAPAVHLAGPEVEADGLEPSAAVALLPRGDRQQL